MQRSMFFFAIYSPLMMAQDRAKSTMEPINYGSFIKQIPASYHEINWVTQKDIYKNM